MLQDNIPALLDAWRTCRSPRIANLLDLIDVASVGLSRRYRNLVCVDGNESAKLIQAARKDQDPRLIRALIELLELNSPPFIGCRGHEEAFWKELMTACMALADPRAINPLLKLARRVRALAAYVEAEHGLLENGFFYVGLFLEKNLPETAINIPEAKPLTTAQAVLCKKIEKLLEPELQEQEASHLATIEEEHHEALLWQWLIDLPQSDTPRQALGEWLVSKEELYGSFILQQLNPNVA